ncbi:MAG: HIT family protein [Longicatena sp.]
MMCIFCQIVNKEIPSYCIYEDEQVMAFLDISQVTKGHTLIIPKKHVESLLDCDDEILVHMSKVAKMLANRITERTQAKGMNILSNIHEIAGQSVPHFHIHLIPRYQNDDAIQITFNKSQPQDFDQLVNLLK